MNGPPSSLLAGLPPSSVQPDSILEIASALQVTWLLVPLSLAAAVGTLREALLRSLPERVLAGVHEPRRRARLAPLLERVEPLATRAALLQLTFDAVFVALLLDATARGSALNLTHVLVALIIAAPALLFFSEALPNALARARGDALLVRVLPAFDLAQRPLAPLGWLVDVTHRALLRVLGVRDDAPHQRRFVEGLREVLDDGEHPPEIDETARELIENVLDFRDADAAEVMTPRTEVVGVDVREGIEGALRAHLESGHSRLPVFDESIDSIIGSVVGYELVLAERDGQSGEQALRAILRPPFLVPETKKIPELLLELRERKQKLAIVLDEYGGTAGVVTLQSIIEEIVGEMQDDGGPDVPGIRQLEDGRFAVPAGLHVSDVNESLELGIPEEADYETLGGFVLSQLGRLPKVGESFSYEGFHYAVIEATDRRVIEVAIRAKPSQRIAS